MKRFATVATAAFLLLAAAVAAQAPPQLPKTSKVSGTVVALTDTLITIERRKERWEIARTPETRIAGGVKVGQRVAVTYRMTATGVEVKADDAKKGVKQ